MSFQPPKGTADLMPPRSHAWRRALKLWDDWTERFGYPLVATPIFEATELFERGVGGTTEVVTKQMYTFTDKGGRSLTLRPEGTAGVVRAYLDSGATGAWKGAYSGPFFRYERPQKGRYRQFWQLGVEYLGVESAVADAEVIELGYRFLESAGAREMALHINSIGDAACRPAYVEQLRQYLEGHRDELSEDGRRLIETNPLRVLDSKVDRPKLADPPLVTDHSARRVASTTSRSRSCSTPSASRTPRTPISCAGSTTTPRTAFEFSVSVSTPPRTPWEGAVGTTSSPRRSGTAHTRRRLRPRSRPGRHRAGERGGRARRLSGLGAGPR